MTYRDDNDALRSRISALQDKLQRTSQQRVELERELGQARRELAARGPTATPRLPRVLLLIGAIGAAVDLAMFSLWAIGAGRQLPPTLSYAVFSNASLAVGLGFLGLFKVARGWQPLGAAVLCFAEILLAPLGFVDRFWGLGSVMLKVAAVDMVLYGARNLLAALAILRPTVTPPWLRVATGVLLLGGAVISLLRVPGYLLEMGWLSQLKSLAPFIHLAGAAGMGAIFLLLRRRPSQQ